MTVYSPHLVENKKGGEHRVWIECEADGKTCKYDRPLKQGGAWILVEYITPLRIVPWDEVRQMQDQFRTQHNIKE